MMNFMQISENKRVKILRNNKKMYELQKASDTEL